MKYNIYINQKAIVDNNLNMDIKDAVIVDFMRSLLESPKIDKLLIKNKIYFWMKASYFVAENPLLGINSSDGLYRRLIKLNNAGLIEPHPDNKKLNKSYYCFTDFFYSIFTGRDVDDLRMKIGRSDSTYGRKSEGGTDENRKVPTDENRKDYNIIDNNNKDYNMQEFFKKNSRDKNAHKIFVEHFHNLYLEFFKTKYKFEAKDFNLIYTIIDDIYDKISEKSETPNITLKEIETGIVFFIKSAISLRSQYFLDSFNIPNIRLKTRDIFLKLSEIQNGKSQQQPKRAGVTDFKFNVPDPRFKN